MAIDALRPGASLGVYPQRRATAPNQLERVGRDWLTRLAAGLRRKYRMQRVMALVNRAATGLETVDDDTLDGLRDEVRYALVRDGLREIPVLRAFAMVREYAQRSLQLRPYDVQVFGAWVIVNGNMAEMATGEGKTLTATLSAATAALAGIPVHVITTNEYLAQRDAGQMRALYEALGLSVTAVVETMTTAEKQAAYRCDIVYCTNKQVAFDYLRDRLVTGNESGTLSLKFSHARREQQMVLRGLCFAIVDEADSVLIDEARTPLILSREHSDDSQQQIVEQALALARGMEESRHFRFLPRERKIKLCEEGRSWLAEQTAALEGVWTGQRHAQFLVHQALAALHLFLRDTHYLVRDGRIEIIDRNTGRTMADRSWQRGLHQMIECKEQCKISGHRETLSSISYQRFFRRYLRLAGMSGTLRQVSGEMRTVYQQRVIAVPRHRPSRRQDLGMRLYRRSQDKWRAVLQRVEALHGTGQPVLVGTASVHDSELLGSMLVEHGLAPRVLNARQDKEEARIIACAGQRGQITIATNMAGRGTDIELGPGVEELGGLHVISTDCHEEYRVDRQLFGRCARQGDSGSTETLLSLNDNLLQNFYPGRVRRLLGGFMGEERPLAGWPVRGLIGLAQARLSRRYRAERRLVMQMDEKLGRLLSYTGRQE